MKVTTEELTFDAGFTEENDLFNRRQLYNIITGLIKSSSDESLVLSLADKWGSGKTSFIKMFQHENEIDKDSNFETIYFDAYENDYQNDPFLALASQIYGLLDKQNVDWDEIKNDFLEASKGLAKTFLKQSVKSGLNFVTAGIVNGPILDQTVNMFKDSLNTSLDIYIDSKLKSSEQEKNTIVKFRESLLKISEQKNKKIIFIIDELDRARPDFSLDLIEKIKHLFSVKGVVFLLVMNREQFEESIKFRYGNIDSRLYLNKFIHFWFELPRKFNYENEDVTTLSYIEYLGKKNSFNQLTRESIKTLSILLSLNNCTLREAERCFSLISYLFKNKPINSNVSYFREYEDALVCAAFLKVTNPVLLKNISQRNILYKDVLLKLNIPNQSSKHLLILMKTLEVELMSKEEFLQQIDKSEISEKYFFNGNRSDFFKSVSKCLELLSIENN
ncbi:P-loop NTPase fold protein [Sodalis sp. RH19]|uniref:KAP family P-loop NTPase fold protein n=1 Tax=Sodalis sp. RH19 TaxID=3394334 RepID=UPI0039B59731